MPPLPEPICNLDAEQGVLSAILLDNTAYWKITETLPEEAFYKPSHRKIYATIRTLLARQELADLVTVTDALERQRELDACGGTMALTTIMQAVVTTAAIRHHAKLVREAAWLRRIQETGHALVEIVQEDRAQAEVAVERATRTLLRCFRDRADIMSVGNVMPAVLDQINEAASGPGTVRGLPTGFQELDTFAGGLDRGDNVVITGRTGMGKTAVVLHMLQTMARAGHPVGMITLEMGRTELVMRLLAAHSGLAYQALRSGRVDQYWPVLASSANTLGNYPFHLVELGNVTMGEILEVGRRLVCQHGIEALAIDNLNLVSGGHRYESMSENSRLCKIGAKELHVVLMPIHQLRREVDDRPDRHPELSDLKQSGQIENDADKVLALYRPNYYDRVPGLSTEPVELLLLKHRNGPVGRVVATYCAPTMGFVDEVAAMTKESV